MNDDLILIVGALIAIVTAGIDEIRTQGQNLTGWGVIAIAAALLIVGLR